MKCLYKPIDLFILTAFSLITIFQVNCDNTKMKKDKRNLGAIWCLDSFYFVYVSSSQTDTFLSRYTFPPHHK